MLSPTRQKLQEIIFEADTPAGKAFDVALLLVIILSIVAVSLIADWLISDSKTEKKQSNPLPEQPSAHLH